MKKYMTQDFLMKKGKRDNRLCTEKIILFKIGAMNLGL